MNSDRKFADLRTLARMAAHLAGRDPDERVEVRLGHDVAFSNTLWCHPNFQRRAETAYAVLAEGSAF